MQMLALPIMINNNNFACLGSPKPYFRLFYYVNLMISLKISAPTPFRTPLCIRKSYICETYFKRTCDKVANLSDRFEYRHRQIAPLEEHLTRDSGNPDSNPELIRHYMYGMPNSLK